MELKQLWENPTCEGRLICPGGHVSSLNKRNPIQSGLRLALGAFCTSPVSSLYTETNKAPSGECRLKLSMHNYLKTSACIDIPAHYALNESDWTTKFICPQAKWERSHDKTPTPPIALKVEAAMTSAEINAELICPLGTPSFPPGIHDYDSMIHNHWRRKQMYDLQTRSPG